MPTNHLSQACMDLELMKCVQSVAWLSRRPFLQFGGAGFRWIDRVNNDQTRLQDQGQGLGAETSEDIHG